MKRVLFLFSILIAAIWLQSEHKTQFNVKEAVTSRVAKRAVVRLPEGESEKGEKQDGYSRFAEFHRLLRTPDGQDKPGYLPNYQLRELEKSESYSYKHRTQATTLEWKSRGPGNIPGRTRSLLVLPNDPSSNTWMAGSVGGGIWKTTDAGSSWTNITPDLPNLAISTLALCSSVPSVIYAGTGEAFGNLDGIAGAGIFKSADGGVTWHQLAATVQDTSFKAVNRIIVDPSNPDVVVACANTSNGNFNDGTSGIFRSEDGGASWTKVYASNSFVQQVIAAPGDFLIQYAAVYGEGVLKSTDGGKTWTSTSNSIKAGGRIELAVSAADASKVAAAVVGNASGEAGADLYLSSDGGTSWAYVAEENDENFDFLDQGDYDNAIMFSPIDDNVIYVGGVNIFKFTVDQQNSSLLKTLNAFDKVGTSSFIDFVPFTGNALPGLELGSQASEEIVDVEIRFGPGVEQKAARFTVNKQGGGVPASEYIFRDYVSVPFQAWDITNNKQLMVSFRDQQENGVFNLIALNTEGPGASHSREYIFVHLLDYAEEVDLQIATEGGHEYKMLMNFWPVLAGGGSWNAQNLPASKLVVSFASITRLRRSVDVIADGYGEFTQYAGGAVVNPTASIHVDHHALIPYIISEHDSTFRILAANDGGVYYSAKSKDPGAIHGDWTFAGTGMVTGQYYGVDKRPGREQYIGGLQDNSTSISNENETAASTSTYRSVIGGDGFDVIWNNAEENQVIGSAQFNYFMRSEDYGASWQLSVAGLPFDNAEEKFPFFSRLANSRSAPEVLFTVGTDGIYRSIDFGKNWTLHNVASDWSYRGSFTHVEVSKANPAIVWAGGAMSGTQTLQVSTDRGETFVKTNNYQGASGLQGVVTSIASHPLEDSTAFALFSFQGLPKILRTTNLGQTWENISGFETTGDAATGFPDVAVYSLLVLPNDPSKIWAGTEIGIYESANDGQSWVRLPGFPAVAVWKMKVVDNEAVVATHGRGIYTAQLENVPETVLSPMLKSVGINPSGQIVAEVALRSSYDSTHVIVNGAVERKLGSNSVGAEIISLANEEDSVSVLVKSYKAGKPYFSLEGQAVGGYNPPVARYINDFDSEKDDFFGTGFSISKPLGFLSKAIHSKHKYDNTTTCYFNLRTPVVISESNATFSYRDIAIIETGEEGATFGEADFYDYVVVEGSTDGANWKPLANGYDASFSTDWENAINEDKSGNELLYTQHNLDLHQSFSAGDTVLFRFRLFADQAENGWGWAIDDLLIQAENIQSVANYEVLSGLLVYPNPVDEKVTIEVGIQNPETLHIALADLSGRILFTGAIYPGGKKIFLSLSDLKSGLYLLNVVVGDSHKSFKLVKK